MLNPYLLYIKLGLLAVALSVLAFAGYKVHGWHQDSQRLSAVQAEAAAQVAQAKAAMAEQQKRFSEAQRASEGYQHELSEIRARPVDRSPIRLCLNRPRVPGPDAATGGSSPALPAAGVLPEQAGGDPVAGPDIGADLRDLAREADEVAAKGRAIQGLKP